MLMHSQVVFDVINDHASFVAHVLKPSHICKSPRWRGESPQFA